MKLHDGPVVQVNNRSNKHMLAHSGGSLDANTSGQQVAGLSSLHSIAEIDQLFELLQSQQIRSCKLREYF